MDFAFSERATELLERAEEFMRDCVYPAEETFNAQLA